MTNAKLIEKYEWEILDIEETISELEDKITELEDKIKYLQYEKDMTIDEAITKKMTKEEEEKYAEKQKEWLNRRDYN